MIGKVISWNGSLDDGFIKCDGSDEEYFLHLSEVKNTRHIRKGCIVEFETEDVGKSHLRAVNVYKVGHGLSHPFIKDLERIADVIKDCNNISDEDKLYRLNDIQMLINYFTEIKDIKEFPDVRKTFRPKINLNKDKNE